MKKLVFLIFVIGFASCTLKEERKNETKTYFDLDGYFKSEATRLSKKNGPILKTVWINGKAEQKKISIKNWEQEFSSFTAADINKASWRGSFKVEQKEEVTSYTSASDKIPVKKLEVYFNNKTVVAIKVLIINTNDLYTSKDSLCYYPDSLYLINKTQKIRLMDEKKFVITGRFK